MEQQSWAPEDQLPEGELDIKRPLVLESDERIEKVVISLDHPQCIVKIDTKLDTRRWAELIS